MNLPRETIHSETNKLSAQLHLIHLVNPEVCIMYPFCYCVVSNDQYIAGLLQSESKGQYGSCMQCAVWQRHLQMCGPFSLQVDHWSTPLHERRVSGNSTWIFRLLLASESFSPAALFHPDNQDYTCWREAHTPFLTSHSREAALSPSNSIVLLQFPLTCLSGMGGKYLPTNSATLYMYPPSHKFHHKATTVHAAALIL